MFSEEVGVIGCCFRGRPFFLLPVKTSELSLSLTDNVDEHMF